MGKNGQRGMRGADFWIFFERERDFSLNFRLIRPSDSFGPRRKAVLRGEGNT